ncbi:MAG: carboxypeptidase-like regulatory domain-containing protein [Candidatus Acidiferrales bacterium]
MKISRKLALIVMVALAGVTATALFAQGYPNSKGSELRTVRGSVVDKQENPVETAVVYLKNLHTNDVVTHISGSDGRFRFSGLDLNVDYEIHAEHGDMQSTTRTISSFDTRKDFVVSLKLDRRKSGK